MARRAARLNELIAAAGAAAMLMLACPIGAGAAGLAPAFFASSAASGISAQAASFGDTASPAAMSRREAARFRHAPRRDFDSLLSAGAAARGTRRESPSDLEDSALRGLTCGNGLPEPGEQCDDGNLMSGDGCSAGCLVEPGTSCSAAAGSSAVDDGGFELGGEFTGGANPFWAEQGSAMSGGQSVTPICSDTACGLDLAVDGRHFAWFGGLPGEALQTQSVSQSVFLSPAATELTLWTRRGACHSSGQDVLTLSLDGTPVLLVGCGPVDAEWQLQTVSLAAGGWNDGAMHTLAISGTTRGSGGTDFSNIFVDFAHSAPLTPVPSFCADACGDGLPDVGEACDDGNNASGDGCSATCLIEPGYACGAATLAAPSLCDTRCVNYSFDGLIGGGTLIDWTLISQGANAFDWSLTDGNLCAGSGNLTGGTGEAACIDSGTAGPGQIDAWLCSPRLDFPTALNPTAELMINYQRAAGATPLERLELLFGTAPPTPASIGGYTMLQSLVDSVGTPGGPGANLSVPMTPGSGYLCVRYRSDNGLFAQVDNVGIDADVCDFNDEDDDTVDDEADNCIFIANTGQQDDDGDNIGNACDGDFDQDCQANFNDLFVMKTNFFMPGVTDLDSNGNTDFVDLALFKALLFLPPGPSGLPNLCDL